MPDMKKWAGTVRKSGSARRRAGIAAGAAVLAAAAAASVAAAAPSASAATAAKGTPAASRACNPEMAIYVYGQDSRTSFGPHYWKTRCGDGTLQAYPGRLAAVGERHRKGTPLHRIWVHYTTYTGKSYTAHEHSMCLYKKVDNRSYQVPAAVMNGQASNDTIQLSPSTRPC